MNITLDTTVIVKSVVQPRRQKADAIQKEQFRLYELARSVIERIESGKDKMSIPSSAII